MHRCKISLLLGVMNWWSPNASILSNQFSNLIFLCYAYSENAGLLGLTRVGSRRVVQISAGFMLFFSVLSAVFHIAIFYFLFMNELNFISHGNQCFRFSFCPVLSWLLTTVLLKRLLIFFLSFQLEVFINFANRNLAPSLHCLLSNCSYTVATYL